MTNDKKIEEPNAPEPATPPDSPRAPVEPRDSPPPVESPTPKEPPIESPDQRGPTKKTSGPTANNASAY